MSYSQQRQAVLSRLLGALALLKQLAKAVCMCGQHVEEGPSNRNLLAMFLPESNNAAKSFIACMYEGLLHYS